MVVCTLDPIPLDPGVEIKAVDWMIADNTAFLPLTLSSLNDTVHKDLIIFNEVLDPNIKWYGKAKLLLTTGYTVWGNINVFNSVNIDDIIVVKDMPSRISVPLLKTDSDQNYHDLTLFTITAEGFSVIGNSSLEATTWILEDVYGNVVWSSIRNLLNKEQIVLKDIILKTNSIYRVKAIFHSTSGDISPIGVYTIRTIDNDKIYLQTYLDNIDFAKDQELVINKIENVTSVTWSIVQIVDGIAQVYWNSVTDTGDVFKTTIPKNTLIDGGVYILKITTNIDTIGNKFIPFIASVTSREEEKPRITKLEITPSDVEVQVKRSVELKIDTDADELIYKLPDYIVKYVTIDEKKKTITGVQETTTYEGQYGSYYLQIIAKKDNHKDVTKIINIRVIAYVEDKTEETQPQP